MLGQARCMAGRVTWASGLQAVGLVRCAGVPAMDLAGVVTEVLAPGLGAARRDIALSEVEDLVVSGDGVAVGPVAAEEDAIVAEESPHAIQLILVGGQIERDATVDGADDLRSLDVDVGTLGKFAEVGIVLRALLLRRGQ